jgi:ferredoxin--NADP+ reductase
MQNNSRQQTLSPVKISAVEEISPGAYLLSFPRNFSFSAGQVLKIALGEKEIPRMYSICSGENDTDISILFNVKPEGSLTPHLSQCKQGDTLFISAPLGSFTGDNQPAWMIATGTGLAPFYSMLHSGLSSGKTVIHGVRHLNQFYFDSELTGMLGERYIKCCSRDYNEQVFAGRVTDYLQQLKEIPSGIKYYLCGNGLMVVEVRDLLIARGIPYTNIISEIYF